MEVRLSLHEVISKSTQALKALNFPPGLDIENGKKIIGKNSSEYAAETA